MKNKISLDFIIFFIGGFSLLNSWSPFNILNFIIFFIACFVYLWFDNKISRQQDEKKLKKLYWQKGLLLFITIGLVFASTLGMDIVLRAQNPALSVHDNVWQVESAIKYLLDGKNPYTENYFGTDLERMKYIYTTTHQLLINPALYHLIKLPFHLLFSIPFYSLARLFFNFYDQRIVYFILFIFSLLLLYELPKKQKNKYLLVVFYAFNPLFAPFLLSGRDDVFVLFWFILTIYLLQKNKITWSALSFALACSSKHSAWFFVPFYYIYLFYLSKSNSPLPGYFTRAKQIIKRTWPLPIFFILIITPFIIWDPISFYQDIYAYPAGTLSTSYPINGYGVSVALYKLGLVNKITDYLPLWIVQIPLTLIVYYYLLKKSIKISSLSDIIYYYAVILLIYWLFSRFFHDNYVGYLSQLFLIAYFIHLPAKNLN